MKVHYNQVLSNLNHFRSLLEHKHTRRDKRKKRTYPVWLDLQTGIMDFAKKTPLPPDQKKLQIIVRETARGPHFELEADFGGVDLLIQKIAEETLQMLNLLANIATHDLPERQILLDLPESSVARIDKAPGWRGFCTRKEAEERLREEPPGTYILREGDPLTRWMVEQYPDLHGYLLTIVESDKKIADYLILKTERGWAFHRDEPDLSQYRYLPTLQALLDSFQSPLTLPEEKATWRRW